MASSRGMFAALSLLALAWSPAPAALLQAQEVRAAWLTQYTYLSRTEPQLRTIAQNLRSGGVNTVYFNVYGGGGVTYWPSSAFRAAGGSWGSNTFDWTAHLVRIFREEGLAVGAWFEYGLALSSVNHPIAVAHPDWLARDSAGSPITGENNGFVFLSPGHPEVVALMEAMARELAEGYDFDDIQLDRLRWGRRSSGREYGYEAVTAARYQSQFGVPPPSSVNNSNWVAFRETLVDDLVRACHDAIESVDPWLVVSSAPTGSYGWTQHMQRWDHWLAGGYIDLVLPQMYTTSVSAFRTEFDLQRAAAGNQVTRLGVGYRAQDTDDWTTVRSQLQYARANGVPHASLWVYHSYSGPIAIQDELDNLPLPGNPWEQAASNPFVTAERHTAVVDNNMPSTLASAYSEVGLWSNSAQPDGYRFGSRVAASGALASATFEARLPRSGRYEVFVRWSAASNRNAAAEYAVHHSSGTDFVLRDQRTNGGRWVSLGEWLFDAGPRSPRVSVSNRGAQPGEFTSSDAVRLVRRGEVLAYCAAKVNSLGCLPLIEAQGAPSFSASAPFRVVASNVLNQAAGLYFFGYAATDAPLLGGRLCVQPPFVRTVPQASNGLPFGASCSGRYEFVWTTAAFQAAGLAPGDTVFGQFWSRDPQHPDGTGVGLTAGLGFVITP